MSGMTQYASGKWYMASPSKTNFAGALSYCSGLGLNLTTVATSDDLDNVLNFAIKFLLRERKENLIYRTPSGCYTY